MPLNLIVGLPLQEITIGKERKHHGITDVSVRDMQEKSDDAYMPWRASTWV